MNETNLRQQMRILTIKKLFGLILIDLKINVFEKNLTKKNRKFINLYIFIENIVNILIFSLNESTNIIEI